ncbi:QRFP-like peptide receptor [Glandiceps talaboti]
MTTSSSRQAQQQKTDTEVFIYIGGDTLRILLFRFLSYKIFNNISDMDNTTNFTLIEEVSPTKRVYPHYPDLPKEYEVTLYVIFFILIICGNIWVIIAVIREPKLRKSTTNWFIVSLSVSDLLVAFFQVTYQFFFDYYPDSFNNIHNNIYVCRTFPWIQWVSRCATVFSLVGIAMDRFRAIVQPLKPKINRNQATVIITVAWLSSFAYSSYRPVLYTKVLWTLPDGSQMSFCTINRDYLHIYRGFFLYDLIVMYLLPLITICVLYAAMISSLWFSKSVNEASTRNKRRAVKMLCVVVLLFALSWFPYYWVTVYYYLNRDPPWYVAKWYHVQWHFAHTCFVSNSFVNPFLYAYFNERFRREFYRMFPCLKVLLTPRVGPDTGTSTTSQAKSNATTLSTVSQAQDTV